MKWMLYINGALCWLWAITLAVGVEVGPREHKPFDSAAYVAMATLGTLSIAAGRKWKEPQ